MTFTHRDQLTLDLLKYLKKSDSINPRNPLLFLSELSEKRRSELDISAPDYVNGLFAKGYISESTMKEGCYFLTEAGKEEIRRLNKKSLESKTN